MKYIYAAAAMKYGEGYFWHKFFDFPKFPYVTKTLTAKRKIGLPFAIVLYNQSIYNKVGWHNIGFMEWLWRWVYTDKFRDRVIVSLGGTDSEIEWMIHMLENHTWKRSIDGIELNFSCPNVSQLDNIRIPNTRFPISLKLRYDMDPYYYDLDKVNTIRLNSVPHWFGAVSGKAAQKKNWEFIEKFIKEGLNISGCSFIEKDDIYALEAIGCKEISIGSTMLINPGLIVRDLPFHRGDQKMNNGKGSIDYYNFSVKKERKERKGKRKFTELFDPYNIDHIVAFDHLQKTGTWPVGFIPDDVYMDDYWRIICYKIADAWIEQAMAGHIMGIPPADKKVKAPGEMKVTADSSFLKVDKSKATKGEETVLPSSNLFKNYPAVGG